MEKFFKLHNEQIIGYKALTKADLGLSSTSHQTHIGLFDDVLTFLPNEAVIDDCAMLIYESNADILSLNFDRIQNPDGTFRSPKIKIGGRDTVSIASTVREIVRQQNSSITWYLFWFGLESGQVVFWLFNEQSNEYTEILNLGLSLNSNSKGRLISTNPIFSQILEYIEQNIDTSAQGMLKELEIETQIPGRLLEEKKIRTFDIERARKLFSEIGKQGEEFIAEYFDKLKFENQIKSYCWANKSSESGYPFDFYYQDFADNVIYLDVKTTKFDFEQKIIYSDKEVGFAVSKPQGCYNIYRVYNLTENNANLRICRNCSQHFEKINNNIVLFQNNLGTINTNIHAVNVAFQPNIDYLSFDSQINLSK